MKYSYIIIDNDKRMTQAIQLALSGYDDFICLGIAEDEDSGLDLILERTPTLVFLNIEMPSASSGVTAFYLMNELHKYLEEFPQFVVSARTAQYALEGIKNSVLDYLLRPLDKGKIRQSLFRFKKVFETTKTASALNATLCLKSYGDYKFINTNDVLYLKADNNTTDFIRANGTTVSAFKTLKYFQESLPDHFIRVHNSYIVNSHYISRIHFGKSECTMQHTNASVPFSKSYRGNVEVLKDTLSLQSLVIA